MSENIIIPISRKELTEMLSNIELMLKEMKEENALLQQSNLFSINEVRKKLGISHTSVKNLILNNKLKATPDNRISEYELKQYLKNCKKP